MLIETIRTAREADLQVKHTTAAISCTHSAKGQSVIRYTGHSAIRTDGVEATIAILDQLKKQLAEEKKYAEECRLRMEEELHKVPDATTRKLFLRRFYENRKWEEAARLVGLSTGTAKMRYKRYIVQEVTQDAA